MPTCQCLLAQYNFEAAFYGVFGSNHPELAASYFRAVVDGVPAARRGAAARFASRSLGNCSTNATHFNAHISPWGFGDYDDGWEDQVGQHMHWNGAFAAMLFINHWEYTRNTTFVATTAYPFLTGLLDFWSCWLTKNPAANHGDGHEYVDWPDQCAEGQTVTNPQMALAFVPRIAEQVIEMATALDRTPPATAADILRHLSRPNSNATSNSSGGDDRPVVWTNFRGAQPSDSNMWALYPVWPAEHLSAATNSSELRQIARATAREYLHFAKGRPVQTFAGAVRAGVSGSAMEPGASPVTGPQWSATDVVEGLNTFMASTWGPNLLAYTDAGGIENIG